MRFQKSPTKMTEPNAQPNPAHAKETIPKTELFGSSAMVNAAAATSKTLILETVKRSLSSASFLIKVLKRSFAIEEDAASIWEDAVLMIAPRIPQ